ncbi:MAG: hypothetical protein BGO26_07185 [Actinobacteria bacterium 69-20]|nr:TIGR04338 family metallohydrolase [Actinomycetota bacterium]OJV30148.1 MAG: hypothetical protein BGO26_07185 [Actinobacteria bacterium 69-20]
MSGRARDRQRSAVYAAEDQVARILDRAAHYPVVEIAGSRLTLPPERRFADIASVQRHVDAVLALPWVRQRWSDAVRPVRVRERGGAARAHYEVAGAVIAVPVPEHGTGWALRELVVLHEIAHHLGGSEDTGHGPAFAGRMLELVDGIIGAEVALVLRVALADQGAAVG